MTEVWLKEEIPQVPQSEDNAGKWEGPLLDSPPSVCPRRSKSSLVMWRGMCLKTCTKSFQLSGLQSLVHKTNDWVE